MTIYMFSQDHRQCLEEFEFQQYILTWILTLFYNIQIFWFFSFRSHIIHISVLICFVFLLWDQTKDLNLQSMWFATGIYPQLQISFLNI